MLPKGHWQGAVATELFKHHDGAVLGCCAGRLRLFAIETTANQCLKRGFRGCAEVMRNAFNEANAKNNKSGDVPLIKSGKPEFADAPNAPDPPNAGSGTATQVTVLKLEGDSLGSAGAVPQLAAEGSAAVGNAAAALAPDAPGWDKGGPTLPPGAVKPAAGASWGGGAGPQGAGVRPGGPAMPATGTGAASAQAMPVGNSSDPGSDPRPTTQAGLPAGAAAGQTGQGAMVYVPGQAVPAGASAVGTAQAQPAHVQPVQGAPAGVVSAQPQPAAAFVAVQPQVVPTTGFPTATQGAQGAPLPAGATGVQQPSPVAAASAIGLAAGAARAQPQAATAADGANATRAPAPVAQLGL